MIIKPKSNQEGLTTWVYFEHGYIYRNFHPPQQSTFDSHQLVENLAFTATQGG